MYGICWGDDEYGRMSIFSFYNTLQLRFPQGLRLYMKPQWKGRLTGGSLREALIQCWIAVAGRTPHPGSAKVSQAEASMERVSVLCCLSTTGRAAGWGTENFLVLVLPIPSHMRLSLWIKQESLG